METFFRDLRLAFRNLSRSPAFTATALLCLALGMGASSAIFSVVDAVLLRPLPFEQPERVVMIWDHFLLQDTPKSPVSAREFLDLRKQSTVFTDVGALAPQLVSLTGEGEPRQLLSARASASLFPVLGVQAALGRLFSPGEDHLGHNKVAVLSHGLWQDRFGSDPRVLGRKIDLDGDPYTVIGVLPESFRFGGSKFEIWTPQALNLEKLPPRNVRFVNLAGRLKPGVTLRQAQAELDVVARRFQRDFPESYPAESGWGMHLVQAREDLVGEVRRPLLVLMGAVGLVLLIACANVANLMLARASSRRKEVAIRTALGAGRSGLVRQFLTEGLVLSGLGAVLGLLLAFWINRGLAAANPGDIPRLDEAGLSGGVLLFTLAVVLATGTFFGLVPALQTSGRNLRSPLQEGGKTSGGGASGQRTRGVLVVLEIALALVVLIGAGLMVQSFRRLLAVDPGFHSDGVFTLQLSLPRLRYPEDPGILAFYRRLLAQAGGLPGVESAALASQLPLGQSLDLSGDLTVEGRTGDSSEPPPVTGWRMVSAGYFKTLGVPLLQGRAFTESDDEKAPGAVILDQELAARLWPGASPLGKRLRLNARTPELSGWRTVVGVAGHVRQHGLNETEGDQLYVPLAQYPVRSLSLALRTAVPPETLAEPVRRAVWSVDPNLPIVEPQTMEALIRSSLTRPRFNMSLFGAFALAALLLTVVGVYGVMAYSVSQRTRELGVRMALGAQKEEVVRLVVRQGLMLTAAGVLIGLAGAWSVSRVMINLLFGVEATDLTTFAAVSMLLGALALAASYFPARRAAKVDPLIALRYE